LLKKEKKNPIPSIPYLTSKSNKLLPFMHCDLLRNHKERDPCCHADGISVRAFHILVLKNSTPSILYVTRNNNELLQFIHASSIRIIRNSSCADTNLLSTEEMRSG